MTILMNVHGNKCIQATHLTRLRCVRQKCVWNDQGACFYTGEVEIGYKCTLYTEEKPEPVMPKDFEDPACSSGRRCWVTAHFFGTNLEETIIKKNDYFKKYPTEGYSTDVPFPSFLRKDGFWEGIVRRYSTCD